MIKAIITTSIALLFGSAPIYSQSNPVSEKALWKNELFKEYKASDEIVSLRTLNSKSFKSGNKVVAIAAAGPLNYFENNQWKTIFHTIVPSSSGFQNVTNSFKSFYPSHSQGSIQTRFENGALIKEFQQPKMYYLDQAGNAIHEKNIEHKTGTVAVNELTYKQVYGQHIDLRLSQLTTKRKLDYIINSRDAFSGISSQAKKVVFQESIELPGSWTATLVDDVIVLKDGNGVAHAYYEKPLIHETLLHDHKNHSHDHAHQPHEIEGEYVLTKIGNSSYQIETIVDLAWLRDADRVFPLYIDPTINCEPQNATQWTGHLSLNGPNLTSYGTTTIGARNNDVMRLGRLYESPNKFLNSWAKFDITAVPDNSTICNVELTYTVYSTYGGDNGCGTNVNIRHMANDPVPAANAALLTDIRDGDIYQTRNFGGAANGPNGTRVTPNFGNIQHIQNSLVPNWVALGFEYYLSGAHDECYIYVRGYSHVNKPFLRIQYSDATGYTTVGYTAAANGTLPPSPNCTDWSGTWCAGSGTFSQVNNIVQGANYSVENLGTAACGTAMPNAHLQAWAPGGALCNQTPVGSPALNNFSFTGTVSGNYYFNVSTGFCGAANTCGQYTGHDFTGQSAVLRYKQNTTVTNTTPNTDLCYGETKTLSAVLGGVHSNPTVVWTISQGAGLGTISGNTFTAGTTAGQVTIEAVVGFCRESITFNVNEGPQLLNTNLTICSGEVVSIPINTNPPVASYTWTHTPTNVTGGSDGSGTTINQTLTLASGSTGSVVYSITATLGACTSTSDLLVTVNNQTTPTFTPVTAICEGEALNPLPTTSTNGITGTWAPALNNTQTTTYTFTPAAGQCAVPTTLTVTVNPLLTPAFSQVSPICENTTLNPLPTTSTNGVTGTWSPAPNNTQTTTYTFTPAAGQCASSATMTIQVSSGFVPTFNPVSPVCAGASVNPLPAASIEGTTGTWTPAWNNAQTTTYTFTPAAGQCSTTATLTVTINQPVVPAFNAVSPVCAGGSVNPLPTSSTNGITGTWTPAWNNMQTTTYTFTPGAGQCASPATLTVTVHALPVINAGIDQSVCTGSQVTLTASGGTSYVWNNGVNNGVAFTPVSTATYTVTGTAANGCQNTDQVLVTVNPFPAINAGPDQSVCTNGSVTLSGSGGISYTWTNGVTNGVAFAPAATATYTVTGTDANGCQNTDQVTVTVHVLPVISAGADQSICLGGTITLSGSGGVSYAWNNGILNGVPFNPASTTTYTVTGTDVNGCQNTDNAVVTISPNPPVSFGSDVVMGCAPLDVHFSLTSQPGVTYAWNFGDGAVSTTGPTASHQYTGTGCFDVSLVITTIDGCTGTQTLTSYICVEALPEASFNAAPTALNFSNSTTTFTNTSTGASSYVWDFGDYSPFSTVLSPTHTYSDSESGSYEVVLVATNQSGCTDTAKIIIVVQEEELIYIPSAFTPDADEYNPVFKPVITKGVDPTDYALLIYNRWGELIFESHDTDQGWDGTYGNFGLCQDGVYTWMIEYKSTVNSKRIKKNGHVTLVR